MRTPIDCLPAFERPLPAFGRVIPSQWTAGGSRRVVVAREALDRFRLHRSPRRGRLLIFPPPPLGRQRKRSEIVPPPNGPAPAHPGGAQPVRVGRATGLSA